MDKFIEELKEKCKSNSPKHPVTLEDFKVIYYLYNDPMVCREKIKEHLKRGDRLLIKIDRFINEYIEEHNTDTVKEPYFLEDIMKAYLDRS